MGIDTLVPGEYISTLPKGLYMSQSNLKERLGVDPIRPKVVADCVALVENQVKQKGGLSGVAIKGAYGTIKRIKKGFVTEVIEALLDDWLDKIQTYYDTWSSEGSGTLSDYLSTRSDNVAEDLLTVTDVRAQNSRHTTARKAYQKMRGSAKKHVIEAVPPLARLIERNLEEIS